MEVALRSISSSGLLRSPEGWEVCNQICDSRIRGEASKDVKW